MRSPHDWAAAEALNSIVGVTLDAISDGIQIVSREWRYHYLNEAACRHGRRAREELLGRTMMECYPGIDETHMFRALSACMQDRTARSLDNVFTYFGDGPIGIFDLRVEPCPEGILILSVDVTERRRLEAELRQGQKMEAMGRLAGGVAHDFDDLLTAMEGFASFALDQVGASHPAAKEMRALLAAVERASVLTRRVRQALDEEPPEVPREAEVVDRPLVLIVDDDEILRRSLRRQLSALGCDVLEAVDGSHAVHVASEASPAVIFLDLYMPGTDGHSLLRRLPISGVRSAPVVMSGEGNIDDVIVTLRNGACDFLKKPWSTEELASSLRRALAIYRFAEGSEG